MVHQLQDHFGIPNIVHFEVGNGGLIRACVATPLASAEIYLHGAHVTQYQPAGQKPVLWMSDQSVFQTDKPIRGGVPICFPWFGPRAGEPAAPIHGFARVKEWQVESATRLADGAVELGLALSSDEQTLKLWPHEFTVKYRVRVGSTLQLTLEVHNDGREAFSFEEALHTYFAMGDVRQAKVHGLENTTYIDKTDNLKLKPQGGDPITVTAETDRVYLDTQASCLLEDPTNARRIRIAKEGSRTTVVWNPWIAKAKAMADFGDDEWPHMMCVETANAGEQRITLPPGEKHQMGAILAIV